MAGAKLRVEESPKESEKKHKLLRIQNKAKPRRNPQLYFYCVSSLKKLLHG